MQSSSYYSSKQQNSLEKTPPFFSFQSYTKPIASGLAARESPAEKNEKRIVDLEDVDDLDTQLAHRLRFSVWRYAHENFYGQTDIVNGRKRKRLITEEEAAAINSSNTEGNARLLTSSGDLGEGVCKASRKNPKIFQTQVEVGHEKNDSGFKGQASTPQQPNFDEPRPSSASPLKSQVHTDKLTIQKSTDSCIKRGAQPEGRQSSDLSSRLAADYSLALSSRWEQSPLIEEAKKTSKVAESDPKAQFGWEPFQRFARNIIIQTQQTRQTKQAPKRDLQKQSNFKYRYHNIYKNLLRDIKIYFKARFTHYKATIKDTILKDTGITLNYYLGEALFPFFLIDFVLRTFDHEIVRLISPTSPSKATVGAIEQAEMARNFRRFIFKVGSYIVPKRLLVRFESSKPSPDKLKYKMEEAFRVIRDRCPHRQIFELIVMHNCQEIEKDLVPGGRGTKNLRDSAVDHRPQGRKQREGAEWPERVKVSVPWSAPREEDQFWEMAFNDDFFGELKDWPRQRKASCVTEVYKLFFKFSIEKLSFFAGDVDLLGLLIQYVGDTKLERYHTQPSLRLNATCYYRATENLINLSSHKTVIVDALHELGSAHRNFQDLSIGFGIPQGTSFESALLTDDVDLTIQEGVNSGGIEFAKLQK